MIDKLIKEELFKSQISVIVLENIADFEKNNQKMKNKIFIVILTFFLNLWNWKSSTSF